jgi:hypothetical protein
MSSAAPDSPKETCSVCRAGFLRLTVDTNTFKMKNLVQLLRSSGSSDSKLEKKGLGLVGDLSVTESGRYVCVKSACSSCN